MKREKKPYERPKKKHYDDPSVHTDAERMVMVATGRQLTTQQKTFAKRYARGDITKTGAAIKAGYSMKCAAAYGSMLTDPKQHPQVVEYIRYLREEAEVKYGVNKQTMLKRLHDLSVGAERASQFSAAINAEKIRGSLAGLTIDRRETVSRIEDMTKEQVIARLEDLRKKNPSAFAVIEGEYKEIKPDELGTQERLIVVEAEDIEQENVPQHNKNQNP